MNGRRLDWRRAKSDMAGGGGSRGKCSLSDRATVERNLKSVHLYEGDLGSEFERLKELKRVRLKEAHARALEAVTKRKEKERLAKIRKAARAVERAAKKRTKKRPSS